MTCRHKDCDGSKGASWFEFEGEEIRMCPITITSQNSWAVLRMYSHYKNGFLPVSGGILDQTNHFNRSMEIIDGLVQEYQNKQKES